MARVCLITPGQLCTNPRLVKEADSLAAVGYEVHVISSQGEDWVRGNDQSLSREATWSCSYVGGVPSPRSLPYLVTRVRHRAARSSVLSSFKSDTVDLIGSSRVAPELRVAALHTPADLYIAHYPAALPAAASAAAKFGVKFGYDLEDLYVAEDASSASASSSNDRISRIEDRHIRDCAYVTASSPDIARTYGNLYSIPLPTVVLNVFPLAHRSDRSEHIRYDDSLRLYWFSQSIGPSRGIEDAVRAMGILNDSRVELHLRGALLAGYAQEIARLAMECGVSPDRIVFHPPASPRDMVRLSADYDVGLALEHPVSPSRDLCLTNKLFTYVLAGNAVAGTATTAQRPVLEMLGDAAVSYEPGDVEALAAGLSVWLRDRSALQHSRRLAWHLGTQQYNWDSKQNAFLRRVSEALA